MYVDPNEECHKQIFETDSFGEGVVAIGYKRIGIVVPHQFAQMSYNYDGGHGLTANLIHELMHITEYVGTIGSVFEKTTREHLGYRARQGFQTGAYDQYKGAFFAEGLPEIVAGLYLRKHLGMSVSNLCSIEDEPSRDRPEWYTRLLPPRQTPYRLGMDAHTFDLLSWAAHERGITHSKDELLEQMLNTARSDYPTMLEGFRRVPQIINAVQPGLYSRLREVGYSYDEWESAMHEVYDVITH